MEIGDRVPSRQDSAYFDYRAWCERLRITPASYDSWLRVQRLGISAGTSLAGMSGLGSYAESRARLERMRAAKQAQPLAPSS